MTEATRLLELAEIEALLSYELTRGIPSGTVIEGSPSWHALRRADDASARAAGYRAMARAAQGGEA